MEQLRSVCEDILEDVEGSLGCAAIDLETGSTLAAVCRPASVLDAGGVDVISVAVSEMFHGRLIRQFHRAWSGGAAAPERFVREVQMATANSYQFMSVVPGWDDCLLVLVTDRSVSLGLGWMAVHQGLSRIAELPRADAPARMPPARPAPRVEAPAPRRPVPEARPRPPEQQRSTPATPPPGDAGAAPPAPSPPPAPEPAVPPSPPPPDPVTAAPPAARRQTPRQRTYRGVPLGKPETERSDEDAAVPMGPRGRMFPRR